ncbi:Hypp5097 [Branchiostoma lanceolatum]|uniref:Hypp5097 protein n=1 Tax=Branchiostoma lanceolatum TaxID=7740 RepID=A0A8K0ADJ0_BRALA|nr:Hypp5097 [Branchiostoma lanceolatum]
MRWEGMSWIRTPLPADGTCLLRGQGVVTVGDPERSGERGWEGPPLLAMAVPWSGAEPSAKVNTCSLVVCVIGTKSGGGLVVRHCLDHVDNP